MPARFNARNNDVVVEVSLPNLVAIENRARKWHNLLIIMAAIVVLGCGIWIVFTAKSRTMTITYNNWCPSGNPRLFVDHKRKFFITDITLTGKASLLLVADFADIFVLTGIDEKSNHTVGEFQVQYDDDGVPLLNQTFRLIDSMGLAFDHYVFELPNKSLNCCFEVDIYGILADWTIGSK